MSAQPEWPKLVSDIVDGAKVCDWAIGQHHVGDALRDAKVTVEKLIEALDIVERCAYAVSTEIDARGYRWSEAYLDQALPIVQEALALAKGQQA